MKMVRISPDALQAIKDACEIIRLRDINDVATGRGKGWLEVVKGLRGADSALYVERLVDVIDTLGALGVLNTDPDTIQIYAMIELGRTEMEGKNEK